MTAILLWKLAEKIASFSEHPPVLLTLSTKLVTYIVAPDASLGVSKQAADIATSNTHPQRKNFRTGFMGAPPGAKRPTNSPNRACGS
jgi:hypothetical protein